MSLIAWIIFGAIAGWIASMITGTNHEMGAMLNIIVGIMGAIIGGTVAGLLGIGGIGDFNLVTLITAILGSVALLSLVKAFDHQPHNN